MITLKGRDILAKYLTGQTASYASHIAIGCGALPTTTPGNYQTKTELDFEMGRFPITSASIVADKVTVSFSNIATTTTGQTYTLTVTSHNFFIGQKVIIAGSPTFTDATTSVVYNPNGVHTIQSITGTTIVVNFREIGGQDATNITTTSKSSSGATVFGMVKQISLTAELPYSGRYEITELGLYSYGDNPYVSGISSQILSNFLSSEDWKYYASSSSSFTSLTNYSTITDATNNITITDKAFRTNSDNAFFNSTRVARQERARFLQDTIIVSGTMSEFSALNTIDTTNNRDNYINLSNFSIDLSKNKTSDEIRIAYSLINAVASPTGNAPKSLNIMLEFITKDGIYNAKYHFRDTDSTSLVSGTGPYASTRYKTKSLKISDGTIASGFYWQNVGSIRIWASIESAADYSGSTLSEYAICLDAIRIENKSNTNPIYGLVGYSVVNSAGTPLIKNNNMTHQVEFRYILGETDNV